MNLKQRREYEQMNLLKVKSFERIFMRKVYNRLKAFNMKFVPILKERGIDAAKQAINKTQIDTEIGNVIRSMYKKVGLFYAKKTYVQIQKSARQTPKAKTFHLSAYSFKAIGDTVPGGQINFNDKWVQMILEYFRQYLLDKAVVPITIESKDRAMQILDMGIREGWTIERMAKELETDRLLMYRARLIVRTETAKAAFYGRRIGAADSGYETLKEWISAQDSRVRHSHRQVDGEMIDMNAKYQVPVYKGKIQVGFEMLVGPGDPNASAGNVCNCRCTEAYQAKRDDNGRLIKKPISRISIINPGSFHRPITTITI